MLRLLAATALIIALTATSALSQDTRTDELARAQAEKAGRLAPDVASLAGKAVELRPVGPFLYQATREYKIIRAAVRTGRYTDRTAARNIGTH